MSKYLNKIGILIISSFLLITACTKETSYESGLGLLSAASGTLKDSLGNCQNIAINGSYVVDTVLTDSNYITVTANITQSGTFKIYTDTVNGFWFRDSAYTLNSGTQTFKLKGYGKPILPLASNFTVYFNTSYCLFNITVGATSSGSSGGTVTTSGDYFPTTANSNWTYQDLLGDTVKYTCTNYNVTVNSNIYKLFVSTQGDSAIYRKDSLLGNYYTYGTFAADSRFIEYKFLDDKVAVNSFWESDTLSTSTLGFPITYKIRFTIDAKNAPYTINGIALDSVIKVRQEVLVQATPGLFTIQNSETTYSYYAKKVGLVWLDFPNYTPPAASKITRYTVY